MKCDHVVADARLLEGLGLWVLLQMIPGLNALLLLRPQPELIPWVVVIAVVIVLWPSVASGRRRISRSGGPPKENCDA